MIRFYGQKTSLKIDFPLKKLTNLSSQNFFVIFDVKK